MKFDEKNLEKVSHPLVGFGGGITHPAGRIDLPVRVGDKKKCRNLVVRFLVVKDLSAYNIIIGRPTLNRIQAAIVPSLMLMKFSCEDGSVGTLYGDHQTARDCYLTAVKPTSSPDLVEVGPPETSKVGQKRKTPTETRETRPIKQEKQQRQ